MSAFGDSASMGRVLGGEPVVVEYRPDTTPGRPHDPRKHAVAITYPVETRGEPVVRGDEALDFRWCELNDIDANLVGFGQETVIARLLDCLTAGTTT
jgi:hypothetical protein